MKKVLLKIVSYIIPAVVMIFAGAVPINGAFFATIRAGEDFIVQNQYTDKTVEVVVGGETAALLPVGICLRGDTNSDEKVDVFDAVAVARYTVGKLDIKNFEGSIGEFAGNVDMSPELDVFDAVAIAKFTVSGKSNPDDAWAEVL